MVERGQAPAIYLTCEDDVGQLHWRQAHICEALGVPMASLAGKLEVASLRGALDNALRVAGPDGEFTLSASYHRIAALIRRTGAKLVALDNVAHLFPGNENDRGEVTRFVNALNRLAGNSGAAIILLGHTNDKTVSKRETKTLYRIDCNTTAYRTLSLVEYNGEGDSLKTWSEADFSKEAAYPPPGSNIAAVIDIACNDAFSILKPKPLPPAAN